MAELKRYDASIAGLVPHWREVYLCHDVDAVLAERDRRIEELESALKVVRQSADWSLEERDEARGWVDEVKADLETAEAQYEKELTRSERFEHERDEARREACRQYWHRAAGYDSELDCSRDFAGRTWGPAVAARLFPEANSDG